MNILRVLFCAVIPLIMVAQSPQGVVYYEMDYTSPTNYDKLKLTYPEAIPDRLKWDSIRSTIVIGVIYKEGKAMGIVNDFNTLSEEQLRLIPFNIDTTRYIFDLNSDVVDVYNYFYFEKLHLSYHGKDNWKIDYAKTKEIDGHTCYFATYNGANLSHPGFEKITTAWFDPEMPLGVGPGFYGGLPGLIIELNHGNERYTATQIITGEVGASITAPEGYTVYTEELFLKEYKQMVKRAKDRLIARD